MRYLYHEIQYFIVTQRGAKIMRKSKMVSVPQNELKKLKKRLENEEKKKAKKALKKADGMNPFLVQKIRSALREVWHRSEMRKLCVKRVTLPEGYFRCENLKCKNKKYPKVFIDHIEKVGDLDSGFLERLFCPSHGLQALCKNCHDEKTKAERALSRNKTVKKTAIPIKSNKKHLKDFY
jgi:hypothetical protein